MPTDITLIQHKRGSAAALAAVNPILTEGEMCIEEDTLRFKFGDGVSAWNDLEYAVAEGITGPTGVAGPPGSAGATGATGPQGAVGVTGATGPQGVQGVQGEVGAPFAITKIYSSLSALLADSAPTNIAAGQFAVINTADVNDSDNAKLYLWTGTEYTYVTDLSGADGIQGPQGTQGVQGVTGQQGPAGETGATGSTGPQGASGATGATGPSLYTDGVTAPENIDVLWLDTAESTSSEFIGPTGPQGVAGPPGATGPQGATGPTGPAPEVTAHPTDADKIYVGGVLVAAAQGPTGPQGTQGDTGATGPQGEQGLVGATGPQGIQGNTGATGAQGETGATGPQGIQGDAGATGPQGATGPTGPAPEVTEHPTDADKIYVGGVLVAAAQGPTGPQGETGLQGAAGSQGISGPAGVTGATGPQGLQGAQGATGPQGPAGAQGAAGPQGLQGAQGPAGVTGATGPQGLQGAQGAAGPQGFQGAQGAAGPQGLQGAQGAAGVTGATGPQGPAGAQGAAGPQGLQGAQGPAGVTGATGPQGTSNYLTSASFYNSALTLSRLGLTAINTGIGTPGSEFGNIDLMGSVRSSNLNAFFLNRTHSGGLTAMAGGTYPAANDGGLVSTYGGSHPFSPSQVHLYYNNTIRLIADVNGVTVYGTFTNNSDATQKENVVPLSGCLDLVNNLNPVSFNFKPEEGLHDRTTVGFIAQEVQQTFSGLPYELGIVREIDYPTVNEGENTSKKILGISETNLVAVLTKAVQELTARVESLESRLD